MSEDRRKVIVDTEDAMTPVKKRRCPDCNGLGAHLPQNPRLPARTCSCGGTGKLYDNDERMVELGFRAPWPPEIPRSRVIEGNSVEDLDKIERELFDE